MNRRKLFIRLSLILTLFVIFISVAYSSLSTTLSIDGKATFRPVDMIRVMFIEQDSLLKADEIKSDYSTNYINTLINIDELDGMAVYKVNITNLGQKDKVLSNIVSDIFSNSDMEYKLDGLKEGKVIKSRDSIDFKITFKYKDGISSINSNRLNAKIKFLFDDYIDISPNNVIDYDEDGDITVLKYNGDCNFNGKNNNVSGVCSNNNSTDFINTGIKLFNEKNYLRNFILSFTIKNIDSSRFSANKRDTIFSALYEANDNIKGKYPGILLRIEGSKWQLQAGNGRDTAEKKQFSKDELLNKQFKIIRYTNEGSTKIYYMIGDTGPFLLKDITNLYDYFDTPLTLGANLQIDNITPDRFALATLENFSFEFLDDSYTFNDLVNHGDSQDQPPDEPEDHPAISNVTFSVEGPCIFNGSDNISGANCSTYAGFNYINSGISVFSQENYKKDFDISLNIADFVPNSQSTTQATILNSLLENNDKKYPAFVVRRAKDKIELKMRNGVDAEKVINIPANIQSIRLVRKSNKFCYSIDGGILNYAYNYDKVNKTFDLPVTFGSSIDQNGSPWRNIKGTLSNMSIKLGDIGDVTCG